MSSAAHAGEELARTIAHVGENAAQSSRLAAEAVYEAERTSATIDEMAAVAHEIGKVTELITAIAGQTNLLALNATIEAARAGESGRGFAVVAQEVKALAAQTAGATQEISSKIAAMQSTTSRSVAAIEGISATIRELDRFSALIASAVEQQAGAARQISGDVSAAARRDQVSSTVSDIEDIARETSIEVLQIGSAAARSPIRRRRCASGWDVRRKSTRCSVNFEEATMTPEHIQLIRLTFVQVMNRKQETGGCSTTGFLHRAGHQADVSVRHRCPVAKADGYARAGDFKPARPAVACCDAGGARARHVGYGVQDKHYDDVGRRCSGRSNGCSVRRSRRRPATPGRRSTARSRT